MKLLAAFEPLRNREYRLLWLGAVGSLAAAQMRQIANGYLAFDLTGSATVLAAVILAQSFPSFILSMFGGVIADRVKRRQLLLLTQGLICVDSGLVAVLVVTGWIEVWHIAALGVMHGSVLAFNQPSRQAYMVELAGSENITQAIALYNSGQTAMRIVGPSIAGALIAVPFIGIERVFIVITATYWVPVFMLLMIRARPASAARQRRPILTDLAAGFNYIRRHEVLRILVIVGIVPPILGNHFQHFLPVFASGEVLDVGSSGLGLMATCTGIGAFLGSLAVASFGNVRRRGLVQMGAGVLFGLTLVFFGLAREFPLVLAALVGVGFAFGSFQTLNSTLTIGSSEPEYYGRVSSVQQINNSMGSLVIVPAGIIVDEVGAPTVMLAGGALILVFWGFVGVFLRSYRSIEMSVKQP